MEDIYIKYLREYYEVHGTINDISTLSSVEYENQVLNIGNFLGNVRKRYKEHLAGKREFSNQVLNRFSALNEMEFEWNPRAAKSKNIKETDPYLKYLIGYYKEHGTINDIKKDEVVEFEEKRLCIGSFLAATKLNHRHHLNGDKTPGCSSKRALLRYEVLEELEIDWTGNMRDEKEEQKDDLRFRFLKQHYEEHGTINDITTETIVEFEGETLKIGSFFDYIRTAHRIYTEKSEGSYAYNERSLKRYALLDELGFNWTPNADRYQTVDNDIYIRYLKHYFEEHGTINDIPTTKEVEFEGKIVKIGCFLNEIRQSYEVHREGKGKPEELSLSRYKALNSMYFNWTPTETKADTVKSKDPYIKYLTRHYNLYGTINDIQRDMEVEFEGKKLCIGSFITATRVRHRHYINGDNTPGCGSKTSLERYRILEQLKIEWEPRQKERERKLQAEDKHLRYLRQHYKENGTINDITVKSVVMFEGELLKIGNFLLDIRRAHRTYLEKKDDPIANNPYNLKRYEALDTMEFDWNPKPICKRGQYADDDIYIRYLQVFYMEHGSLDDITLQDMIEFEGIVLRVRDFISNIKTRHNYYLQGIDKNGSFSPRSLKRYALLDSMNFNWENKKSEVAKLSKEHNIPANTLYDNLNKFDGNLEKALAFCLRNRKLKDEKEHLKREKYKLTEVLTEFDINLETLISYLDRESLKISSSQEILYYNAEMTLREFCTKNGYNYDIISKAVRLKMSKLCDESLESLINRCLIDSKKTQQKSPSTWIYAKYGNELLVRHMLIYVEANPASVLRDMSWHAISIEEAFKREAFRQNSKNKYNYLEGVYNDFIDYYQELSNQEQEDKEEALVSYMDTLVKDYHLSKEEFDIIKDSFTKYTEMVYSFHLFEVGFEKDNDKRLQKIIAYRFDEDDIEEAFFIPLKFEERVLLGRDSELYKRRTILKNLTVSWNYLTAEEQRSKIKKHNLTEEELHYVNSTRQHIDEVKKEAILIKK